MSTTAEDDRYAYSRAALARLALSDARRDLADRSASGVPTDTDPWSPGEHVRAARELVHLAEEVLTRAVVYERSRGTSWEAIGSELDITRQSAHTRFRDDEARWQRALLEPVKSIAGGKLRSLELPEAAYRPTAAGQQLDHWARIHCPEFGDVPAPVTGNLAPLSTIEEMNQVLAAMQHLYADPSTPPDPAERLRLAERKAALLERIAVEEGSAQAHETAAGARALVAELRSELEQSATGTE
ncbi:hypothetical protein [Nocardia nova]|uniref:hypothetical protein n=1 Tax=Nocardia nova TaxID=37330 RepID=UPI000CE9D9E7|nr:hypothetical protein [Nocardia nova]PPI89057.1 hypothetical protein C5E46_35415 [Nocardia nova]